MSSNIRYLSQHSLAVYESTLIDRFEDMHKRNQKKQAFAFAVWMSVFLFLAVMTMFLPASLQAFLEILSRS